MYIGFLRNFAECIDLTCNLGGLEYKALAQCQSEFLLNPESLPTQFLDFIFASLAMVARLRDSGSLERKKVSQGLHQTHSEGPCTQYLGTWNLGNRNSSIYRFWVSI